MALRSSMELRSVLRRDGSNLHPRRPSAGDVRRSEGKQCLVQADPHRVSSTDHSASVVPEHGKLEQGEVGKGLEVDGKMHLIDPAMLEAIKMESSTSVVISCFVPVSEVDRRFFDRTYYLLPQGKTADTYSSLFFGLEETGLGGLCRYVRANTEYLALVVPVGGVLGLHTLYAYADVKWVLEEVVCNVGKTERVKQTKILKLLAESFDPELLTYHYSSQLAASR